MLSETSIVHLNHHRVIRCLTGRVPPAAIAAVQEMANVEIRGLIRLSQLHLRFACRVSGLGAWRQRISRGYYACYSASKAIRLAVYGSYSSDVSDHKKLDQLPDDFPQKAIWSNDLSKFRADRNVADYDHAATQKDLEFSVSKYLILAENFVQVSRTYLKRKGV